ncbi:hypothetical protein Tsubulata_040497 [Turnera subulata]|uniref:Uncharacterized protein n=1 Tax=Turnera subulata TaxID=218843 RepID=A0A9Q0J512_9ROSI|nr:hypothetical protein Tsubulata_040497 [Turnera subulata]
MCCLVAQPEDPHSGDYGYSKERQHAEFRCTLRLRSLGLIFVDCPRIVRKVETFRTCGHLGLLIQLIMQELWWIGNGKLTEQFHDGHISKVMKRCSYPVLSDPRMFDIPIETSGHNYSNLQAQLSYLSSAPPEV